MILSGVTGQVENLDTDSLSKTIDRRIRNFKYCQRDLRILLLHLRPTELEGKSLVEGLNSHLERVIR